MARRLISLAALSVLTLASGAAPLPNDPLFATNQWPLDNPGGTLAPQGGSPFESTADADIDAPEAWSRTVGSSEITVAIVDVGADLDHPDLVENLWVNPGEIPGNGLDDDQNGFVDDIHGWDFIDGDPLPDDTSAISHGTRLAGFIGMVGDNGLGGTGVCWDVSLMILRVQGIDRIVQAIDYAIANGARVIHTSYGGHVYLQAEHDALKRATDAGLLVVAATGNDGLNLDDFPFYPATHDLPGLITLGASDQNDAMAAFSNFGPNSVDLLAPGVPVWSTVRVGEGSPVDYGIQGGTSFASPHASGVAALMLAVSPEMEGLELALRLMAGVDHRDAMAETTRTEGRLSAAGVWSADSIAPAPATDLTLADVGPLSATITFTSPGDDGLDSTAAMWEVRLATGEISESTWFDAERVWDIPAPIPGGGTGAVRVARLQHGVLRPGQRYHVGIRANDEAGNLSPLSEVLSFRTQPVTTELFDSFETDTGLWITGDDWVRTLDTANYGDGRAMHSSVSPYEPNTDISLTLAVPLSPEGEGDLFLLFESFEDFEAGHQSIGDGLALEVSPDQVTWERALLLHSTATPMRDHLIPLGRWAREGPLHLRFRMFSDSDDSVGAGWWVDNVHIFRAGDPVFTGRDLIIESRGAGGTEPLARIYGEAGEGWFTGDGKSDIPVLVANETRAHLLSGEESLEATFNPWLTVPGLYEVSMTWGSLANAAGVSVEIHHASGVTAQPITQDGPVNGDRWIILGQFQFEVGGEGSADLRADGSIAPSDPMRPLRLEADAVRWRLLQEAITPPAVSGLGIH